MDKAHLPQGFRPAAKKKKQKKQFTFNRQVPKSTHFVDSPLQYGETW